MAVVTHYLRPDFAYCVTCVNAVKMGVSGCGFLGCIGWNFLPTALLQQEISLPLPSIYSDQVILQTFVFKAIKPNTDWPLYICTHILVYLVLGPIVMVYSQMQNHTWLYQICPEQYIAATNTCTCKSMHVHCTCVHVTNFKPAFLKVCTGNSYACTCKILAWGGLHMQGPTVQYEKRVWKILNN